MSMGEPSAAAIGIDLGTTFSVLAKIDQRGLPVTIVNGEGDRLTPSNVLFDGDDVVVGKEALKAIATEAERVAECSKRDMGRRSYHKTIDGKEYPPEVIEAFILNKIRVDAEAQIGAVSKVVITVPAYFDEVRRKATQDAGYMAGFEVLDIINEPTAAAVAFGFRQGYLDPQGSSRQPQNILVYDLGGGTFDVTVMQIRGNEFNALATDGDVRLGGYDWDQRLVDLAAERFARQHGSDPRKDAASAGRLWRECEDAKRTLSARQKAAVACEHHGAAMRIELTRQEFEEATQDLLDRTRFTTMQTLKAAGLDWAAIDRVLLVGGSTRMPMVRDMLRQLSGKEPDDSVAADEAVAHGAALHASLILAKRAGQPALFKVGNINSHSLGVVGIDPATQRRRNGILIPRNSPLPATSKRTFMTKKAGQKSIRVDIIEGESPSAEDCTPIGHCSVSHLPANLPAGSPVDVHFYYKPNGRLKVLVTVPGTDRQIVTEIIRENTLSREQLDAWRQRICGKPAAAHR
jgi:molecular chaperone DnaK